MSSRRELLQCISTIPSREGRIDTAVKLGLYSPDDLFPIEVTDLNKVSQGELSIGLPFENSQISLLNSFIRKIRTTINDHPIMQSVRTSLDQLQLPSQIRDLTNLPDDFYAVLEPLYVTNVVGQAQRRCNSPGFIIRILHRIAKEEFMQRAHGFRMDILEQVAERKIADIEGRTTKQIEMLHKEINVSRAYVINGQRMFADVYAREERIQNGINGFHDGADRVSGFIGYGIGEVQSYTLRFGGKVVWITTYFTAKALEVTATAAVWATAKALERIGSNKKDLDISNKSKRFGLIPDITNVRTSGSPG